MHRLHIVAENAVCGLDMVAPGSLRRHRQQSVALVDHDDIVVFIHDAESGMTEHGKGAGEIQRHLRAGVHRGVEGFRDLAVDCEMSEFQPLLDIAALGVGEDGKCEVHQTHSGV